MHVLPLPFGLALALLSRREADRLRPEPERYPVRAAVAPRDRLLGDDRNLYLRRVA